MKQFEAGHYMSNEIHDYDVFPKVFPAGKEVTITIKPLGAHALFSKKDGQLGSRSMFKSEAGFDIAIFGLDDGKPADYPERGNGQLVPYAYENGIITITHVFPKEQQYYLRFLSRENGQRLLQLSVYALEKDLCGRYPYIGDLHMHTCRSDGRQDPAIVAADYRRYGYDFLAITDHRRYYPSLEAMDAYKDVPIEFNLLPGEEVHMPKAPGFINDVHIVNFGGEYSVNGLTYDNSQVDERGDGPEHRSYKGFPCPDVMTVEAFQQEVAALAETLDIPEEIEKWTYACCVWVFNHIRKAKGLGIFCHPYWLSDVHQVPETFINYMLTQQPFDAFEVLGGEMYYEHNGFQTQKYYEMRARGCDFPIVGSTDSHGCINNEKMYTAKTMVFAPANEKDELIASIKDKYSVAIDTISKEFRLVGDFRLSRYACFLLNEFFPLHDELCFEEGRAMKDYFCGVEGAKETLEFISGRMKRQMEKYFQF